MLSMRFRPASPNGSPASPARHRGTLSGLLALIAALALIAVATPARADDEDPASDDAADVRSDDEYADTDPSALNDFREPLAPYGAWTQDPTYGTVWVPNATVVGADFAPYQTAGHWSLTDDDEWLWVSDYDWGYIPFHYGRWVWVGSHWAWIPGRVYSPAWVSWRVGGGGYLGWAPLPPTYYWMDGVAVGLWTVPYAAYCFVPTTYVFHSSVSTYVVRDRAVVQAAARHTHAYKPAAPAVGHHGGGHASASGRRRGSPTLSEAGVPSASAPKGRVSPDPRSTAYASRKSTAAMRRGGAIGRSGFRANPAHARGAHHDGGFHRADAPSRRDGWQGGRGASARPPQFHAPPAGRRAAGGERPQHFSPPSGGIGRPGAPSAARAPSARSPSLPSAARAPSFHPPAAKASAPTHHAPARSAPKALGRGGRHR